MALWLTYPQKEGLAPVRVAGLIGAILDLLAESLTVGLTFLSRVDGPALHIVRAHDPAGMGLHTGDVIPLCDTY